LIPPRDAGAAPQQVLSSAVPAHHGEQVVDRWLGDLAPAGVRLLRNRRIPHTDSTIDHLVVAPAGVLVIDAKNHRGRVRAQAEGGLRRVRTHRLMVGRRDGSHMVESMRAQVRTVQDCLVAAGGGAVPVTGMLCLVEAEWSLVRKPVVVDGVHVVWPEKIRDYAFAAESLDEAALDEAALDEAALDRWSAVLAAGFPEA
jgi:hypothetical protein